MERDGGAGVEDGADGARPAEAASDPVLRALEELESTLQASVAEEQALGAQVRQLRAEREKGLTWREVLRESDGEGGVLPLLGRVLSRLTDAGAGLRRALAGALIDEGASTAEVAQRFGVSRQRVFRLLRNRERSE